VVPESTKKRRAWGTAGRVKKNSHCSACMGQQVSADRRALCAAESNQETAAAVLHRRSGTQGRIWQEDRRCAPQGARNPSSSPQQDSRHPSLGAAQRGAAPEMHARQPGGGCARWALSSQCGRTPRRQCTSFWPTSPAAHRGQAGKLVVSPNGYGHEAGMRAQRHSSGPAMPGC